MKLFTPLWGEPYSTWFKQGLLPSLALPRNARAIEGCEWIFATDGSIEIDVPNPKRIIANTNLHAIGSHKFISEALCQAIELCLPNREPLLLAFPDFIFQDGTIETLMHYGRLYGVCAGMVHLRADPSILDHLGEKPLVNLFFDHMHKSVKEGEIGPSANCQDGGVSWRWISDSAIAVQHRLASAFIANFLPSDLDYFRTHDFNMWDHHWPSTWHHRLRLIGSSDAAFAVEVTEPELRCPPVSSMDLGEPDKFHSTQPHVNTNRQFVAIIRKLD